MSTAEQPLLTAQELDQVEAFLRESYFRVAESLPAARQRDPDRAVRGEVEQLRKAPQRKTADRLTDQDVKALEAAAESAYASEFSMRKERALNQLAEENGLPAGPNKPPLALLFLKTASRRLCKERKAAGATGFAISTGSLGVLLRHLGLDPVFAPIVVWFATQCRDVGLPVLCEFIEEYLKRGGVA